MLFTHCPFCLIQLDINKITNYSSTYHCVNCPQFYTLIFQAISLEGCSFDLDIYRVYNDFFYNDIMVYDENFIPVFHIDGIISWDFSNLNNMLQQLHTLMAFK